MTDPVTVDSPDMQWRYVTRMRSVALRSIVVTVFGAVACVGCSATTRSVFHPSDPAFTPRAGQMPAVYLQRNIETVPMQRMRSVGLIQVTVAHGKGIDRAVDAAAKKGSELGCWIVIEHSAFVSLESRASLDHGAAITLAHGPAPHISRLPTPERGRIMQFDCIVKANSVSADAAVRTSNAGT